MTHAFQSAAVDSALADRMRRSRFESDLHLFVKAYGAGEAAMFRAHAERARVRADVLTNRHDGEGASAAVGEYFLYAAVATALAATA